MITHMKEVTVRKEEIGHATMERAVCFTSVSPDVCLVAVVIFVLLPTYCTYVGTCMNKNKKKKSISDK